MPPPSHLPSHAPIARLRNNIVLRLWHPHDAAGLVAAANHPAIAANLRDRFPSPYTRADAESWVALNNEPGKWGRVDRLAATDAAAAAGGEGDGGGPRVPVSYAIVAVGDDNQDEEVIGGIGLELGTDISRRTAELGYWLAPGRWGQGIMSEAVAAFCAWAWGALPGLVRVFADIFEWNDASARVLVKAGFVHEARLRAAVWKAGRVADVLVYALVRDGV